MNKPPKGDFTVRRIAESTLNIERFALGQTVILEAGNIPAYRASKKSALAKPLAVYLPQAAFGYARTVAYTERSRNLRRQGLQAETSR